MPNFSSSPVNHLVNQLANLDRDPEMPVLAATT
jgi:hypothetical protein